MIKKALIAFLLALLVVAAYVQTRPATYLVTRTTAIAVPPAAVFIFVNDFHNWTKWSPWAKLDPQMKETYEGPSSGVGAVYKWSGNDKAGEGVMTIAESKQDQSVAINLSFTKPYASSSVVKLEMSPEGAGSAVTWTMTGENNFLLKAMSVFVSMDQMVGADFEKGLTQLKSAAEAAAKR